MASGKFEVLGISAATLAVLACTAYVGLGARTPAPIHDLVVEVGAAASPKAYRALVVFQVPDCEASLDTVLDLLDEPAIRSRVVVYGALAGRDFRQDEIPLKARTARFERAVVRMDRHWMRSLVPLGHRGTPFLVVLDSDGQVRLSAKAPTTPEEHQYLARLLLDLVRSRGRLRWLSGEP